MAPTSRRSIVVNKGVAVISKPKKTKTMRPQVKSTFSIAKEQRRKTTGTGGGVCIKQRRGATATTHTRCSFDGCNRYSQRGGVCITHGAVVIRKRCKFVGCDRQFVRGGVCITHGAKTRQCSVKGCTSNSLGKGGVCVTHGAVVMRKRCKFVGCPNIVQTGGVCNAHGAPKRVKKLCSFEGCNNQARVRGVCVAHGGRKKCSFTGCTKISYNGGVCYSHGGKATHKRCSIEGCNKFSQRGGVCKTHGAIVIKKRCKFVGGCKNQAVQGGVCVTHGAKVKGCSFEGCTSNAQKGGVCCRHRSRSSNANDNPTQQPEVDRINEAIKVFQSQRNPTGADWTHLHETLAPTAVDDVEAVGYMIKKEFSSGWFRGIVGSIRQNAAGGRTRRVYYEDGDSEDLSLMQLKSLPSDANDTKVKKCRAARGVQIKRDTEEFVTCIAAINNNNNLMLQPKADAIPFHQSINYEDEEELNSWIWRSNARMASHFASNNATGHFFSAPTI